MPSPRVTGTTTPRVTAPGATTATNALTTDTGDPLTTDTGDPLIVAYALERSGTLTTIDTRTDRSTT